MKINFKKIKKSEEKNLKYKKHFKNFEKKFKNIKIIFWNYFYYIIFKKN